jgi:hypothetical protein
MMVAFHLTPKEEPYLVQERAKPAVAGEALEGGAPQAR